MLLGKSNMLSRIYSFNSLESSLFMMVKAINQGFCCEPYVLPPLSFFLAPLCFLCSPFSLGLCLVWLCLTVQHLPLLAVHGCMLMTCLYFLVCVRLYAPLMYMEIKQAWLNQFALPRLILTKAFGSPEPHS